MEIIQISAIYVFFYLENHNKLLSSIRMRGILGLLAMLWMFVVATAGSLTTMPVIDMNTIESPSFNQAVQAYMNKYGTNAITFDAVI